jgi:hypothetical protein
MKSMKKILAGTLAASCAMALSAPAQAAITVNDPETTVTLNTTPAGNDFDFSFGYHQTGLDNPFIAVLDFTNTLAGLYSFTLDISSAAVNLTSAELTGGTLGGPLSLSQLLPDNGTTEHWELVNYGLGAGNYVLTLKGTNTGFGSLAGNVTFAAVPEPATWALMILGFGLVGGVLRRKERETRVRYNFA